MLNQKSGLQNFPFFMKWEKRVSSTLNLDQVLNTVVNISSRVLLAEGCALNVINTNNARLQIATEFGFIPRSCRFKHMLDPDAGPVSDAVLDCISRKIPYIGPANQDPECQGMKGEGGDKSVICLPLRFKGSFKGSLCVYNKTSAPPARSRQFSHEDLELLITMGAMISSSLENALTFNEVDELAKNNERLVRNLSLLYEISGAMLTTVKLDELLGIITRALTLKQGLGFDRALVLIMSEEEDYIQGAAIRESAPIPGNETGMLLPDLLRPGSTAQLPTAAHREFLNLKLPLDQTGGILVRTAVEKQSFNVVRGNGEHVEEKALPSEFGKKSFATVPMLAKGKVVGVIAVDRDFSGGPTTEEDMRNLSMLANQAGLAIENSRLYEYIEQANLALSQTRARLIEAEKLAALG